MMHKITAKLTLLIVLTALIPLVLFGAFAISKARSTSIQTVIQGNQNLAHQVAGRIDQYILNAHLILQSLAENINRAELADWQREKILRNYAVDFDEFNFLRIVDENGKTTATSELRLDPDTTVEYAGFQEALHGLIYTSDVYMTDDLTPALLVFLPIKTLSRVDAVLMAEVDLLHLWNLVEEIKIGKHGYLNLLTHDGKIFASGDGATKVQAIQMTPYPDFDDVIRAGSDAFEHQNQKEDFLVVTAQTKAPLSWYVTVEVPVAEAYILPLTMAQQLKFNVFWFLIIEILIGILISRRSFVKPVEKLMQRLREIGRGQLRGRVEIAGKSEFAQLGNTLNEMSAELTQIQLELVRQEKQALLGRIASSIAHDLKHPVTSIENYARILQIKYDDPEYRQSFLSMIQREFARIQTFLTNLRDLSKDIPFQPILTSIEKVVSEVLTTLKPELEKNHVKVDRFFNLDLKAEIDVFSFQRVLNNLFRNAIEAMPVGGVLTVKLQKDTYKRGDKMQEMAALEISDTGVGIESERLISLFDDLKTTKKTGLGLGLAITQKIIQQHNGFVEVSSQVGIGTTFRIYLPLA